MKLIKELGAGEYGKVSCFEISGLAGSPMVAVKSCTDAKNDKRFLQEIGIMKTLRHPFVVPTHPI